MADTEIAATCSHVGILTQQNLGIIFTGKLEAEFAEQPMFNYLSKVEVPWNCHVNSHCLRFSTSFFRITAPLDSEKVWGCEFANYEV